MENLLSVILWLPFAGALLVALLPRSAPAASKAAGLAISLLTFVLSLGMSLLSIVQMPGGIPVATMAIGNSRNAGLLAARILALKDPQLAVAVDAHRASLEREVRAMTIPGA